MMTMSSTSSKSIPEEEEKGGKSFRSMADRKNVFGFITQELMQEVRCGALMCLWDLRLLKFRWLALFFSAPPASGAANHREFEEVTQSLRAIRNFVVNFITHK